jgi:hypothetical protein
MPLEPSALDVQTYYRTVIDRLRCALEYSDYCVASGRQLVDEGADAAFPALAAPLEGLEDLTVHRGLQIHLPFIGARSRHVLMPLDLEIFVSEENRRLYESTSEQRKLLKHVIPVIRFVENVFRSRGVAYLLDYTASGAHLLFLVALDSAAGRELAAIGDLEGDLIRACQYVDPQDLRRRHGVDLPAAYVFSGLGRIADYVALSAMDVLGAESANQGFPISVSDAYPRCINIDNTWNEGSPFMRCIRSPFSLHRKNQEVYGLDQPPLVDVVGCHFDGSIAVEERDVDVIQACMWDLQRAAKHAEQFSGWIPVAGDPLVDLVCEYRASALFAFHREFDRESDLPPGEALERALEDNSIADSSRILLTQPNPAALQPYHLIHFVADLLLEGGWRARHIGNVLRDLYQNPRYGWTLDFLLYPADEKANFWARTYAAITLWQRGALEL